jgi:predicted MFS family arabinose efflux permease
LTTFVLWERRTTNPLLPLRIALDRNRGGSYLVFLLVGAGLFAMFLFLTFYLQIVLQYSPLRASAALLPFSAGIIVGAGLMSQLMPRLGPKPLMVTGLALATIGMLWLTQIDVDTSYVTHVLPSQLVMSLGLAAVFVPASSTALVGIDRTTPVGGALLNTAADRRVAHCLLNTLYAGG